MTQIKILAEEIDDLSSTLKDIRSENTEEIHFLRSQVVSNNKPKQPRISGLL